MRTLVLAALLAAVALCATAQKISAAPAHLASVRPQAPHSNSVVGRATRDSDFVQSRHFHHASPFQSLFFLPGIFPDSSYPDSSPALSEPPPAQSELLLQALSALTSGQQQTAKPDSQSLLIELQGDRYVNLTNPQAPANLPEPTTIPRALRTQPGEKSAAAHQLLPVTLFFRDGHQEDIRDYTIADGIIYARGDFYNDGYWNKRIELSALDLPQTVKSNEARGVRFVLPNSPNEVITRP